MTGMENLVPEFIAETAEILERVVRDLEGLQQATEKGPGLDSIFRSIHTIKGSSGIFGFTNTGKVAHELENFLAKLKLEPQSVSQDHVVHIRREVERIQALVQSKDQESQNSSNTSEFIRVPVGKVNDLMNGISEVFLLRNQMIYLIERFKSEKQEQRDFFQAWDVIDGAMRRGIGDLERIAVSMRMMPIQSLFSKLAKAIESYQGEAKKKIRFETQGENTELDKKVLDTLGEPLVHLVRNAMDHGIESTDERRMAGKQEEGMIRLSASIVGNEVFIEIEDDGKGIDSQKLLSVAKSKGIDISHVTDDQSAIDLIFMPGFSTAEKITDISGRGIGMDAVKNSVTALGGRILISTRVGKGTRFSIKLPVSMSLVPVILVDINGLKYAIPNHEILEARQAHHEQIKKNGGNEFALFRGSFVPCIDLRSKMSASAKNHEESVNHNSIVFFKFEDVLTAARVSNFCKNTEIIVKPPSALSPRISYLTGVAVLPTGEPVFVLSLIRFVESISKGGTTRAA